MTDNIQNGEGVEAPTGCPFCGATPHRGKGKVYHCQLHGDPLQHFSFWCPHGCAKITRPSEIGALNAWNTRHSLAREPATADVERVQKAWSVMMGEFAHVFGNIGEGYYPEVTEMREAIAALSRAAPSSEPAIAEGERIEKAARYVLDNSRRGNASLNADQYDADTQSLMTAYRDIIGKAIASGFLAQSSTPPASKGVEA